MRSNGILHVGALLSIAIACHAFPPARAHPTRSVDLHKRRQFRHQSLLHKPLHVRGGSSTIAPTSAIPTAPSTALQSTAAVLNLNPDAKATSKSNTSSNKQKYLRNAKELFKHVWPEVPKNIASGDSDQQKLASTEIQKERKYALGIRFRVILSIVLMLLGKISTIATPFLFKMLIDTVPKSGVEAAASAASVAPAPVFLALATRLPISLPILLLLSYGLCRSLSSCLRESTTAIFSHVAQSAIRSVGRSTFDHVHSLDLQYHLNRNTGALSRILERGSRSISFALNAMVFNTVPTLLEVFVVSGLMFKKFGIGHSLTVLMTIFLYSAFTIFVTQWRSSIRKDMNALENKASGKISDSLLNYETVKYFNNEVHEGKTYESTLHQYQNMALKATSSLSLLNFGQNAIFSAGLTLIMYLTLRDVKRGLATMGDLVLVNGLLFQISVPLNFIGWVYQELRQSFIDMEAMFQLRDTKPSVVDMPGAVEYNPLVDGTEIEFINTEFAYKTSPPSVVESAVTSNAETHPGIHEEELVASRPILKGTSFTIPQGATVAIVGSSGCGKSTLIRMLYRFYNPDTGTIRIGKSDIKSYTIESIRKAIAVVPQDVVLFNDSIGYNIHYGNLNASWDEVIEASKKAHLHDIIMRLPDGYNTIVGERGLKMSGGGENNSYLLSSVCRAY